MCRTYRHGETPEEAAVRELFEETGIKVSLNELRYVDTFKHLSPNNHHYKYTYFIKTEMNIQDMVMQLEEVSELKYISLEEFEKRIDVNDESFAFSNKEYVKIIIQVLKNVG